MHSVRHRGEHSSLGGLSGYSLGQWSVGGPFCVRMIFASLCNLLNMGLLTSYNFW